MINITHPSRYYIHYLLSQKPSGRNFEAAEIVDDLDMLSLPYPRKADTLETFLETLTRVKKQMKAPSAFNPRSPDINPPTQAFLRRWKIGDAWKQKKAYRRAFEILTDEGEVSRALKVMLLGPLPRPYIAKALGIHFKLDSEKMNPLVVATFEHYFWNAALLESQSWKRMLSRTWNEGTTQDLILALSAPRNSLGSDLTLGIAFRGESAVKTTSAYMLMREHSLQLFLEAAPAGAEASLLSRAQSAGIAFTMFKNTEEEIQRLSGGNTDLVEELRRIRTVYDESPLKSPREIPVIAKTPYSSPDTEAKPQLEEGSPA